MRTPFLRRPSLMLLGSALFAGVMTATPLLPAQAEAAKTPAALQAANKAFTSGYAELQQGHLEQARRHFADAVKLAPQIAEAHEALGAVLVELNLNERGIDELEKAATLKPGDRGIESNLAQAYLKLPDNAKARTHFDRLWQLSREAGAKPLEPSLCHSYATLLDAAGEALKAAQMLRMAIEANPTAALLLDDLGSIEAQQKHWSQAEEAFTKALTLDFSFLQARLHLALVLREEHKPEMALDYLAAGERQSPDSAPLQLELGRTYAAMERDDLALDHLRKAASLDANLPGAAAELAMLLERLGRQEEAIPFFRKARVLNPQDGSLANNLGLALAMTGKADEAIALFKQALAITPNAPVVWQDIGVAHIQLSAFDEAIGDFTRALALDPANPQLHYDLGLAYKFKDRMPEAIAELEKAGQIDPTLEDPPYTLGILYMQLGKLDEGAAELKKAALLRPTSGDTWSILGSTLKQAGRLPEAREALERALPLMPGQPGPRVTLAAVLALEASQLASDAEAASAAGDQSKADQLAAQIKDLRSLAASYRHQAAELSRSAVNRQKASFAMNAGNQLLLRGEAAQAVDRYLEAIAADPGFAPPHLQLALAYERLGRLAEALTERSKAQAIESQPAPAQ